jgi:hypothetical protein
VDCVITIKYIYVKAKDHRLLYVAAASRVGLVVGIRRTGRPHFAIASTIRFPPSEEAKAATTQKTKRERCRLLLTILSNSSERR